MKITNRNGTSRRSVASRAKSLAGVGVGAVLVLAGVAVVGVLPASAAPTATSVSITAGPTPSSAFLNEDISIGVMLGGSPTSGAGGDVVTITTPTAGCVLGGTLSYTYAGTNPMTLSAITITAGNNCTLVATDNSISSTPSSAIPTTPFSTETKLAFKPVPPTIATAGVALAAFKVATEDVYGNVVTSAPADNITISTSGTGCTLSASSVNTVAVAAGTGLATFAGVILSADGSCTLTAIDSTNGSITATPASAAITVSGGTPAKLVYTVVPPASVLTTGTVITAFKVAVEDAAGNIDTATTGSTDSITLSSPCITTPVVVAAVAGVATYSAVEFATTGDCVLTATDTTRALTVATATTVVGEAQAALTVSTTSGYLDAPITLAATGGSGTGAVTFTVTNGTATGCTVTSGVLKATKGGTCIVTAYKAAAAPYAPAISVATTVTISSAPKAVRVIGSVTSGRKSTITVTGYNFYGRPRVTSNVAGFKAIVTRDTGKTLVLSITVTGTTRPGVKVLAMAFANGKHASVKYSLRK